MDKLNAVLLSAICFLLCVSAAVVYGVWFSHGKERLSADTLPQIQEEMELASIAMNDDAQVINGGSQNMWIRAKVDVAGNGEETSWPELGYQLVSDTIKAEPSASEAKKGVWIPEADGYYYYSLPVEPGERSRSLFESVCADTGAEGMNAGSVKVQAEAVQVNWVSQSASTGKEAFNLYKLYQPLQEYKGQCL